MQYYHPDTTQNLCDEDLRTAAEEQEQIYQGLAVCLRQGLDPDADLPQQLAESWRAHRQRYYYDCTLTLLQGFAAVYAADPRHRQFFDGYAPGLAAYFAAVLQAYIKNTGL